MGALTGYKVLDFSTLLPGPYATMTLADLGAEVLKISSKDKYDLVVGWKPVIEGAQVTGPQALFTLSGELFSEIDVEFCQKLFLHLLG